MKTRNTTDYVDQVIDKINKEGANRAWWIETDSRTVFPVCRSRGVGTVHTDPPV